MAGAGGTGGKRILEIRVEEATGLNKEGARTWGSEITDGFVKAELRGEAGAKAQKAVTKTVQVSNDSKMTWKDSLYLDLNEAAQELRLLLCRKAQKEGKERVTVVTACGIFVNDILEAAPIDKYFEMFKPGSGDEGGYVRLKMQMISDDELRARQSAKAENSSKGKGPWKPLLLTAGIIGAGVATFMRVKGNSGKSS